MRMEVEIAAQKQQISSTSLVTKRRATALGTERRQITLQLEGAPPKFIVNLKSFKVRVAPCLHSRHGATLIAPREHTFVWRSNLCLLIVC